MNVYHNHIYNEDKLFYIEILFLDLNIIFRNININMNILDYN